MQVEKGFANLCILFLCTFYTASQLFWNLRSVSSLMKRCIVFQSRKSWGVLIQYADVVITTTTFV